MLFHESYQNQLQERTTYWSRPKKTVQIGRNMIKCGRPMQMPFHSWRPYYTWKIFSLFFFPLEVRWKFCLSFSVTDQQTAEMRNHHRRNIVTAVAASTVSRYRVCQSAVFCTTTTTQLLTRSCNNNPAPDKELTWQNDFAAMTHKLILSPAYYIHTCNKLTAVQWTSTKF